MIRAIRRGSAAALAAAGIAMLAAQTPPQKPADQDPQRPPFRTEANFVRVDVYPTSAGRPLTDLRREDFELLEDGRPQVIETFELVRFAPAGAQPQRSDPGSVEAMRQAAANPRGRLFVIFLDVPHVTPAAAKHVGKALTHFLDRTLGPDDLVGIMTPWMSAADMTLARKTSVIQSGLSEASWGRRFTADEDERETQYKTCYRVLQQELEQGKSVSDLARALILRRREVLTLDALHELVTYLRGIREERKAILTVTEGWVLYRPDARITRLREECTCPNPSMRRELQDCGGCKPWPPGMPWKERPPSVEPIRVGPDGRLTVGSVDTETGITTNECKVDRTRLASIDHVQVVRNLVQDANRANATFYTIDPRGLAAFDTPISGDPDEIGMPLNAADDQRALRARHDSMADLATGTDGIPLMTSNDLDAGLRRISDDLSAYYLLGYYSTNSKLDGKYRAITVRVKRAGVDVRARPGYRALTESEVAAARPGAAAPSPSVVNPVSAAIARLARLRSDARFRIHAIPFPGAAAGETTIWVAGEIPATLQGWAQGGTVSLEIAGGISTSTRVSLKPGERSFLTSIAVPASVTTVDLRARLTNTDPAVTPFSETVRVDVKADSPQALLFRRGPATGNRLQPAADFQFSRTERARLEVPLQEAMKPGDARLLDRSGQDLKIPVTVGERTDAATGQRWLTADVTLAALAQGEYVIEVALVSSGTGATMQKTDTVLAAIRVTR